ncbi:hypothetical protein C8R45DRAFT_376189 [Mycena sanguinolenta]|nr:hypothetical protein C8R45DRAFT_376189 [Mycena sanguinolenta]
MRPAEALSRSRLAAPLFSLPSASSAPPPPPPRRGRPAPLAPAPAAADRRSSYSYDAVASMVLTADRSVLSSTPKPDQTGLLYSTAQGFDDDAWVARPEWTDDDDWDTVESHDESEEEMFAAVKPTSLPKRKLLPLSDQLLHT